MSTLDELLGPADPVGLQPVPAPPPAGWPDGLRAHLSASSLRMLGTCPEQFRRVYIKGERQRPGAALIWGGADHYAHEQNFRQKIESHVDIPEPEIELAFAEGFDQKVEQEGGEAEVDWGNDRPGDLKDKGVKLAVVYHRHVSPRVQPTSVEQAVSLELPGVIVPVVGRIDLKTVSTVIEQKTATAKKTKPEPQWRLQGALYQLASGLPVEWHVKTKTKVPGVYTPAEEPGLRLAASPLLLNATTLRVQRLVTSMIAMYATYGPDDPWPTGAPDYGWACDYCGFRPSCAWWQDEGVRIDDDIPFESEETKLERLLMAYAREAGIETHATSRMELAKILERDGYVEWLKAQLEEAGR